MTTALDRIIDYKKDEVAELRRTTSEQSLLDAAKAADKPRGFIASLDSGLGQPCAYL